MQILYYNFTTGLERLKENEVVRVLAQGVLFNQVLISRANRVGGASSNIFKYL